MSATVRQRHSSATAAQARRMHAVGWSAYRIAKILTRDGTPVNENTVRTWVDPDLASRRRAEQALRARKRNAERTGGRLGAGPPRSPEFKLERIKSLVVAGVSKRDIARVMTFDFPTQPLTEEMVHYALRTSEPPPVYRDDVTRSDVNTRRGQKSARADSVQA